MDILFVISHKPDNRYKKRLELLSKGYRTGIIYWNKAKETQSFNMQNVFSCEIHVKANRTNPLKRIPQTLQFIKLAYKKVKELKPKCLYVGNLDMLMIAVLYKKHHKHVRIFYEIADLHRFIIDRQNGIIKKILSSGLKAAEKYYAKNIDRLILTSMKFYEVYYSDFIVKNKVIFLPNMPEEASFDGFQKKTHGKFTVGFIGWIRYKKQLRLLIEAAEKADVNVIFAGEDGDGDGFERECTQYQNVKYFGPFVYEKEIQKMYGMIDCVYAVYDADMANVRVALPNKLYEAILCEMPIIVAKTTYLSELVLNMGIGSAVSHTDVHELTEELIRLSTDRDYYQQICDHCIEQKKTVTLNTYNNVMLKEFEKLMG